jgi:hypothetical protein
MPSLWTVVHTSRSLQVLFIDAFLAAHIYSYTLSTGTGVSFLDSQLLAETSSADATSPSPSGTASIVGREDAPSGQEATSIPQSYQAGEVRMF